MTPDRTGADPGPGTHHAPAVDHGFIDVNTQIGPAHGNAGGALPADLLRERRSHGIRYALVRHRNALMGETRHGNRELLEACAADPGLLPVATLLPGRTDTLEEATSLAGRVAGFWLEARATPGRGSVATDQLVRAAARTGRPLFVQIGPYGDASAVGAATASLGVPVILAGWHYDNSVDTLAAARQYEHLHLDTSRAAHLGAIEIAVREIGAERVLLGTGAPLRAIQSAVNAILTARIPDDAKRLILAGNATRLFGLTAAPVTLPPVWKPRRNVDVHTHSGPLPWDTHDLPNDQLLTELHRQTNTTWAVASSILAIASDTDAGNREMVEGCRTIQGRTGYLVADPNDIDATREQIRRWGDAPGIVGAKVHCQWSHNLTGSSNIRELFRVLADFGKPVKIHNDGDDWDQHLLRIARDHPKLPIVIAHGGLGFPDLPGARAAAAADNIHLEMCSSFAQIPTVREVVRVVPPHKFLFGTDAPLLEPSFVLGTYQDAWIPEDQQDAVYYANAARLYGLT
jgi:predicted TIM-barrel fold metal-dependent hydrolase